MESHVGQGGVDCLLPDGRIAGLSLPDGWVPAGLPEDEGPARPVHTRSAVAPS
ncbi:hypothetical protein [Streptomyces sp. SH5]|uniref:Uncharacterized protein n=1 Tax=Streptomyces sindenensis TaxID=67363 RepID=A0ABW6EI28_9ACTN|nr:hypothetical protein [Streptomyces sp. SH5]WGP10960.1 hypothetical protein QFA72_15375 [Streptomyces sp. SH5]